MLPPPSGPPRPSGPPAVAYVIPPPPPARRTWIIPVVAGAVVVVLGLGALVTYAVVSLGVAYRGLPDTAPGVGPAPVDGPPADPLAGDPGSPVAVDPLDCVGCLTYADATRVRLPLLDYVTIGLDYTDGQLFDSTVADELDAAEQGWADSGGTPESCFFAFAQAPLAHALGDRSPDRDDDAVHYPSWHTDETEQYWLSESIRVFDDSTAATAHMVGLESAIRGCTSYSLPETGWWSDVQPSAALDVPDDVAAYGWLETAGWMRYYVVDLQRGNLVQRLTLSSGGGDGPTEAEFRAFVESYAERLSAIEPSG